MLSRRLVVCYDPPSFVAAPSLTAAFHFTMGTKRGEGRSPDAKKKRDREAMAAKAEKRKASSALTAAHQEDTARWNATKKAKREADPALAAACPLQGFFSVPRLRFFTYFSIKYQSSTN